MRLSCPHCDEPAHIRTSKRPSPVFSEVFAWCTNVAHCGWSGRVHVEFARTTVPSRKPNRDVRIPMDPDSRKQLLEQLAESA
jgi:C4-type Zn-finger protein